jgi:hypothetical protein
VANDTTYYMVSDGYEKQEDGTSKPKAARPTADLANLQKAHPLHTAKTLDEWTAKVLASEDLQAAFQISLRLASDEDVKDYGDRLAIYAAKQKIASANEVAERLKLEGKTEMVKYFSETVRTERDAANFLSDFDMGAYAFSFYVEVVNKEKPSADWYFAPEAAEALSTAWLTALGDNKKKRAETKDSAQYKKVREWAK